MSVRLLCLRRNALSCRHGASGTSVPLGPISRPGESIEVATPTAKTHVPLKPSVGPSRWLRWRDLTITARDDVACRYGPGL